MEDQSLTWLLESLVEYEKEVAETFTLFLQYNLKCVSMLSLTLLCFSSQTELSVYQSYNENMNRKSEEGQGLWQNARGNGRGGGG